MGKTVAHHLEDLSLGRTTAVELVDDLLRRMQGQDPHNAILAYDADHLRATARASDRKRFQGLAGPLEGILLGVKDNIDTADLPTTGGTAALKDRAPADAPPLAALRSAGALVAAKTNLHELAFGITSNNGVFGPVRNPADRARIAGGSSGGTAAAIAAGLVPAGLGTDTGGSVRIPAALCGVVGFRPTTGRYTAGGVVPLSATRDTIGPLGTCVADVALLDRLMAGDTAAPATFAAEELRIGVPRAVLWQNLEPEVAQACARALEVLAKAKVTLIETNPADLWQDEAAASFPLVLYECMRALPAYARTRSISFDELLAGVGSADVRAILQSQLGDQRMPKSAYEAALNVHRPRMQDTWRVWMDQHALDGAIFPTTPLRAQAIGQDETVTLNGAQVPTFATYIRNTSHGSLIGAPGISLPVPVAGLPIGIEIDGMPGQDARVLAVAACVEQAFQQSWS